MASSTEILNEQAELVQKLKSLQTNFKKDGASRKMNLEYHDERLSNLDKYWETFEQNDLRLATLEDADKSGPYYQNQALDNFRRLFAETRHMILQSKHTLEERIQVEESKLRAAYAKSLDPEPQTSTSKFIFNKQPGEETGAEYDQVDQEMEGYSTRTAELLNEQRSNIKAFERAIQKLNIENISEKWQLEDKLKTISARWESVDRGYWKLDNVIADMSSFEQDYNRLEQMYDEAKTSINKKIWARNHQEQSAPRIELPIFSGNYTQWVTFKDLFIETVHRNNFISNAQKMQHLKAKLRGEAERLIQHLAISSENYETCWSMLQQRYDNTRLLFAYHANELLSQINIKQPTASSIKQLHNTTLENLNAISNLHIDTVSWGPLLVHILQQKLDPETRQSYVESLQNPRDVPKMEDFLKFLENKYIAMESSANPARKNQEKKPNNFHFPQQNKYIQHNRPKEQFKTFFSGVITCPSCKQNHGLYNCKKFLNMSTTERQSTVAKLGICRNCLFSHNGNDCTSPLKCKVCNKSHNTLLHDDNYYRNWNKGQQLNVHVLNNNEEVLLTTVRIEVQTSSGTYTTIRALLDQGSQGTLITERATQLLQLKRNKLGVAVKGVGDGPSLEGKGLVYLSCKAVNSDYTFTTDAVVVNKLTSILPNIPVDKNNIEQFQHIQLADPTFYKPSGIDILFGADVYAEVMMPGLIKTGGPKPVIAQQTRLGWVISGQTKTIHCHVTVTTLEDIAKFWEQEETQTNNETEGTDRCEQHFIQTTTRLTDGRYQVPLPLKPEIREELGTSKNQAVAQFKQLERKMKANPTFGQNYKQFMREYLELGHMKKCDSNADNNMLQYFLPHHGIIRLHTVSSKMRVVFNATSKTSTNKSLNDLMESGPNLQADLQGILLQWRIYQYVLTGDIEKMYRYIAMHPYDQPLQKIIWRWSPHHRLEEYQLCTVTYGTKAAPFLALRTLKQLAMDEGDKYPIASIILNNNFYMDDAIFGGNTIEQTKQARDQLIQLLKSGGLNLRKWASNEPELVEDLPDEMRNPQNFEFTESSTSKALGLGWNPKSDEFVFTPVLEPTTSKSPTKRQILSEISTLFDPLGWLSPITIKTKILFQKVWKHKLEWEDEVPEEIQKEWGVLRTELSNMQPFRIRRWLGCDSDSLDIELLAFCDASEKGKAAVIYSAARRENGKYQISLVAAKTKVSPLQHPQTLPRLELGGYSRREGQTIP